MQKNRFYYGWIIVAVSFINLAVVFGIWYSFSVFFVAVLKEFGWSRAATAGVFSSFMMVHSLSAIVVGAYIDRFSPRVVFPIAAGVTALGLLLSSRLHSLWEFYLWYGLFTPVGICAIGFIAHSIVLPRWFDRKRGLAIGIAMAGVGIGMQVLVPTAQYFISEFGWRAAYRMLAAVILVVLVPLNALLQRRDPREIGQQPDGMVQPVAAEAAAAKAAVLHAPIAGTIREAIATRQFWLLALSFFFTPMAVQGTLIHQVASVVDKGFSAAQGALIFGLAGIMGSGGKILFGYLSDRIGREKAFASGLGCAFFGVVCLLLLQPGRDVLLYGFAVLFGLGYGSVAPLMPSRLADLFLGPDFGKIMGLISIAGGMGGALGVWVSGKIFDLTAGYTIPFTISLIAMVLAVCLFRLAGVKSGR